MRKPPPLLQDAYDLVLDLYRIVPAFPKAQRHVLGQRIEQAALDLLFGIDAANDKDGRVSAIDRASRGLDELRLLVRLATDLRFVSIDRHERLALRLDAIGRQLGGWKKWATSA